MPGFVSGEGERERERKRVMQNINSLNVSEWNLGLPERAGSHWSVSLTLLQIPDESPKDTTCSVELGGFFVFKIQRMIFMEGNK